MKRMLGSRPSPAMVVAAVALFVSVGGVSYGLGKGSVDSREIKNNNDQEQGRARRQPTG